MPLRQAVFAKDIIAFRLEQHPNPLSLSLSKATHAASPVR